MDKPTQFSIDQSLQALRQRFGKSGAFTYDNIDELESHILDGYEINQEKHGDEQAFQLSMESLGDPAELTEMYYQSNQQNIWRNYFWIICMTTFMAFLLYTSTDILFQTILLLMAKFDVPVWFEYMDVGFGISAGIVFILGMLYFRKKAFSIFHKISGRIMRRPISSFALLGIIPFLNANYITNLRMSLMNEELSAFAQSSREIYGIIMYLAPIALLFWCIWRYKQKSYKSFEEKLAARLGLCAIIGVAMTIIVNLSSMIIVEGSMVVVSLIELPFDLSRQFVIPTIIFIGFWTLVIWLFYKQPKLVLGNISQFISKHTLAFLLLSLVLIIAVIFVANISGTLLMSHVESSSLGDFFYFRKVVLQKGFTLLLLFLTSYWTFRRSKNKKLIAWS